jgi:hypothetical protein
MGVGSNISTPRLVPSFMFGLEFLTCSLDDFGFEDYLHGMATFFGPFLCSKMVFNFSSPCTFLQICLFTNFVDLIVL